MDWGKVLDTIKKLIPEIRAKVQLFKKSSFNFTFINITNLNVNFPPGTDLDKLASIPPDMDHQIADKALRKLTEQEEYLDSLTEKERLQRIADVTSEAIIFVGTYETIGFSDYSDAELERKDNTT